MDPSPQGSNYILHRKNLHSSRLGICLPAIRNFSANSNRFPLLKYSRTITGRLGIPGTWLSGSMADLSRYIICMKCSSLLKRGTQTSSFNKWLSSSGARENLTTTFRSFAGSSYSAVPWIPFVSSGALEQSYVFKKQTMSYT